MVTLAFIAALVAVNIAYLVLLDRKDRRHDAQVSRLLQRIQAPAQATVEHTAEHATVGAGSISPFDDEAYWDHREKVSVDGGDR